MCGAHRFVKGVSQDQLAAPMHTEYALDRRVAQANTSN
jgi:hypothetical protein